MRDERTEKSLSLAQKPHTHRPPSPCMSSGDFFIDSRLICLTPFTFAKSAVSRSGGAVTRLLARVGNAPSRKVIMFGDVRSS